ncbi:hypothetical protein M2138_001282 [Dysgonomonadaceae bacterium PH5-43]|nr:hypothetical protein [Dysgonomonadaceae bacterium PH5-43]
MKKMFTLFTLLLVTNYVFAELNPPYDFKACLGYIGLEEGGECGDKWVAGPAYTLDFTWSAPNIENTDAILEKYIVYGLVKYRNYLGELIEEDTFILFETEDTHHNYCGSFIGEIWVVAVYNINGEIKHSTPSNIESFVDVAFPISINTIEASDADFIYDNTTKSIVILDNKNISHLEIVDINGRTIKMVNPSLISLFELDYLPQGVYIIRVYNKDKSIKTKKILT